MRSFILQKELIMAKKHLLKGIVTYRVNLYVLVGVRLIPILHDLEVIICIGRKYLDLTVDSITGLTMV